MHAFLWLQRHSTAFGEQFQATDDVTHAAFGEEHDAAVHDDVRVRPVKAEEIREARHGHAEIGARIARPFVMQLYAVASEYLERRKETARMETGAINNDIDF